MSQDDDYLFVEPLLVERIREQVQRLRLVGTLPELDAVEEERQITPAAYVIYLGDATPSGAPSQGGERRVQMVTQYWAVALAVHYADATGTGEGARREAGPLLGRLLLGVTGWTPAGCAAPMSRAPHQVPAAYRNGFFYAPLVFQTSFLFPRQTQWQPSR